MVCTAQTTQTCQKEKSLITPPVGGDPPLRVAEPVGRQSGAARVPHPGRELTLVRDVAQAFVLGGREPELLISIPLATFFFFSSFPKPLGE